MPTPPRAPLRLHDPRQRALLGSAAAAAVLLAGAAAYLLWGAAAAFGVVAMGGAVLALAWWTTASGGRGAVGAQDEGEATAEPEEPPQLEETVLTLRCGACGSTFDHRDSGTRPLRIECAACGMESWIGRKPARTTTFTLVRGEACRACGAPRAAAEVARGAACGRCGHAPGLDARE